ncbi:hypothetical protein DFH07DRAFT_963860 [Mycena maculata]|uniref:Uncharacterized protein n=1 Tax=Mycena maculata TaxID=230809 RepID=A0AAD7IIQ0_9AGAR|nr:hypothetical protein DFH07DRAFT_963860 [Mycena maculata]
MLLPTFTKTTTAKEVVTVLANQIQGKNGTSIGGIGFEAARVVAKYAGLLILASYSAERHKFSEEAIKNESRARISAC